MWAASGVRSPAEVKKIVKFEACSMETTQIYSVEWEYAEFDKVPAARRELDLTPRLLSFTILVLED